MPRVTVTTDDRCHVVFDEIVAVRDLGNTNETVNFLDRLEAAILTAHRFKPLVSSSQRKSLRLA
jgi:hypothetical protein